jgi:hypothetical protein
VPGRGTSCVSTNFISVSDGGLQGFADSWGHLAFWLPRLHLCRVGGVRCRGYLHPATSSQRPDRGCGARGVCLRLLGLDDHWHVEAKLFMVDYRIKVHMDSQADKSLVVVKGSFFPRVVNPRYRIRGTMCNARIQSSKARKVIY